jgi:hypothetical protein
MPTRLLSAGDAHATPTPATATQRRVVAAAMDRRRLPPKHWVPSKEPLMSPSKHLHCLLTVCCPLSTNNTMQPAIPCHTPIANLLTCSAAAATASPLHPAALALSYPMPALRLVPSTKRAVTLKRSPSHGIRQIATEIESYAPLPNYSLCLLLFYIHHSSKRLLLDRESRN